MGPVLDRWRPRLIVAGIVAREERHVDPPAMARAARARGERISLAASIDEVVQEDEILGVQVTGTKPSSHRRRAGKLSTAAASPPRRTSPPEPVSVLGAERRRGNIGTTKGSAPGPRRRPRLAAPDQHGMRTSG